MRSMSLTGMIPGLVLSVSLAVAGSPTQAGAQAASADEPAVRNVILMVADGAGVGVWSAAVRRTDDLSVRRMGVAGLVDTRNVYGRIGDSAGGATALASGRRTYNGAIGVGPGCRDLRESDPEAVAADPASCDPLETIAELAARREKGTGVVTTTRVTDATPAAFLAHVPSRRMQGAIAAQMLASGADVILGGGRGAFDGSLGFDEGDLLTDACHAADCLATAADAAAWRPRHRRLLGLFAEGEMKHAPRRRPDLPTMTSMALARLRIEPEGFFLLVETEGTDSRPHANDSLAGVTEEILEFDRAVGVALHFAAAHPATLVVVTADHETGGLALHEAEGVPVARYTSTGHTGALVPLFAHGPGAERLGGLRTNEEVGRVLMELMGRSGAGTRGGG